VAIIALMAILSPLASSMFTPGISQIAKDLNTSEQSVIATTTGFVIMLGFGPLFMAPLSETFGRRMLYIWGFSIFTLLQLASALSPNIATLIALRTISGFFGSKHADFYGRPVMTLLRRRIGQWRWYALRYV
jgi:MFS family permease